MSEQAPVDSRGHWTKIAPILISLLTAVTATLSFATNQRIGAQAQQLNQIKADQEAEWKRQQGERDALAGKRADAQVIMSYMTALLSENAQQRRVALNTVYYALGKDLANKLLEGLYETEDSAENAGKIAEAIADGTPVTAHATRPAHHDSTTGAEQKQLVEQFYSKDKTTRLNAFQKVLINPTDKDTIAALLRAGAEKGRPDAATWNAAILAGRLPPETREKLQPELSGFVGRAEQVLTGPEGSRLTAKVKSQLN